MQLELGNICNLLLFSLWRRCDDALAVGSWQSKLNFVGWVSTTHACRDSTSQFLIWFSSVFAHPSLEFSCKPWRSFLAVQGSWSGGNSSLTGLIYQVRNSYVSLHAVKVWPSEVTHPAHTHIHQKRGICSSFWSFWSKISLRYGTECLFRTTGCRMTSKMKQSIRFYRMHDLDLPLIFKLLIFSITSLMEHRLLRWRSFGFSSQNSSLIFVRRTFLYDFVWTTKHPANRSQRYSRT